MLTFLPKKIAHNRKSSGTQNKILWTNFEFHKMRVFAHEIYSTAVFFAIAKIAETPISSPSNLEFSQNMGFTQEIIEPPVFSPLQR